MAPDAEHLRFGDGLEREPQLGCLEHVAVPDAALRAGVARECRGGILARGEGARTWDQRGEGGHDGGVKNAVEGGVKLPVP